MKRLYGGVARSKLCEKDCLVVHRDGLVRFGRELEEIGRKLSQGSQRLLV